MSDDFEDTFRKRTKENFDALIRKTKQKEKTKFADIIEELVYHTMTAELLIEPMSETSLQLWQPLGIDFTGFTPLKQIRIRPVIPSSYRLMKFIILSLKQKIQGLAIVSRQLFSNDVYKRVHEYYKKAKIETDYNKLKILERIQARLFWQNIKKYAQRRGVPFKRRLYRKAGRSQIDLLNHRLNIVGNRLRRKTMETIGTGKLFFEEIETVHTNFSSLDSIEAIRPVLYFIVIRSLSVPFSQIRELVDKTIEVGVQWTNAWIASMVSTQHPPRKISYYSLCNSVNKTLRELGVFRFHPFQSKKVTGYYSIEDVDMISDVGIVELGKQTPAQKAGEKIHRQILSQFPQPINLPHFENIAHAAYPQIIAETIIRNKLDTYSGKTDILIFGEISEKGIEKHYNSNVMLVADIKTYDSSNININHLETPSNQVYQVEQYCKLIEDHNYDLSNTVKAIIHLDRQNIPYTFMELLWIIISLEIEDQQYQKELIEEDHDLADKYFNDDKEFFDLVIPDKRVKITYWK